MLRVISKFYVTWLSCLLILWGTGLRALELRPSIEPYLGYSKFTFSSNGVEDQKYAAVLGGKGGVEVSKHAYLALDYHLGGPYLLENNKNNEYLNRMWGLGGAYLGDQYRAWFGYYYDVSLDDVSRSIIYSGTAFKASLGMTFQSKLSLNLEYSKQNYTSVHGAGAISSKFSLDVSVVFVSISAPIYPLR